jgi:hypothetical protein
MSLGSLIFLHMQDEGSTETFSKKMLEVYQTTAVVRSDKILHNSQLKCTTFQYEPHLNIWMSRVTFLQKTVTTCQKKMLNIPQRPSETFINIEATHTNCSTSIDKRSRLF